MPWNVPLPSRAWPDGPDRPGVATAASVLGFVTGGLTLLFSVVALSALLDEPDVATGLLLLGVPCAAGMIAGGVQLLHRRSRQLLIVSMVAAVVVLVVSLAVGAATLSGNDAAGLGVFAGLAAPLPILTASLAARRRVAGWLAAAPARV